MRRVSTIDHNAVQVLLHACGANDHVAFERLYKLTAARFFGLAVSMLGREDLAEEVLQDAYVQIWRDAARFDPARAAALAWMGAIVRHRALDALRAGHKNSAGGVELDTELRASDGPGPLDSALAGAEHTALERCMQGLSVDQRQCITLAFLRGLSHRELSDTLAKPMGSVKSWLRRGLEQLRRCLES